MCPHMGEQLLSEAQIALTCVSTCVCMCTLLLFIVYSAHVTCMCGCAPTRALTCTHSHPHAHVHTHVLMHMCKHMHMLTCVHMHMSIRSIILLCPYFHAESNKLLSDGNGHRGLLACASRLLTPISISTSSLMPTSWHHDEWGSRLLDSKSLSHCNIELDG